MNERNSGKRVRPVKRRLIIGGIIVTVVLMVVAVIAIPYFLDRLSKPKYEGRLPRLEAYFVDTNFYRDYYAWITGEDAAKSESIDITRFLGMSPKKEYKWIKTW